MTQVQLIHSGLDGAVRSDIKPDDEIRMQPAVVILNDKSLMSRWSGLGFPTHKHGVINVWVCCTVCYPNATAHE